MKSSQEIIEISKALNKLQSQLGTVHKSSKGYNYVYADYASIWNDLREPLTKNGLSVIQDASTCPDGVSVTTTILHTSGQWIEFGPLVVPMGKKDAHSTGSAITYARRYGLSAALGIVPDDDDGKAAQESDTRIKPLQQTSTITAKQHEELEKYLEGQEDLRANMLAHLAKKGVPSFVDLTVSQYLPILERAKKTYKFTEDEKEEIA